VSVKEGQSHAVTLSKYARTHGFQCRYGVLSRFGAMVDQVQYFPCLYGVLSRSGAIVDPVQEIGI
jgi:hypothetical protein